MKNKIKKVATQVALKAGKKLLIEFNKFDRTTSEFKAHHEIVTKADLIAEKVILGAIKKNFPDHKILSEESGDNDKISDYLWVVDPLDGTTNFSMHNPLFSVSIGVSFKGEMVLGIIYAPYLKELFIAEKGKGATLNGKKIRVSKIKKNEKALNSYCHGSSDKYVRQALKYMNYQKLNGFDCRQIGSAAIELAYVACGRIESIVIPGVNSWDAAAGALLVQEAGGRVTDFLNKKWNLKSNDILASNALVHGEILNILKRTIK